MPVGDGLRRQLDSRKQHLAVDLDEMAAGKAGKAAAIGERRKLCLAPDRVQLGDSPRQAARARLGGGEGGGEGEGEGGGGGEGEARGTPWLSHEARTSSAAEPRTSSSPTPARLRDAPSRSDASCAVGAGVKSNVKSVGAGGSDALGAGVATARSTRLDSTRRAAAPRPHAGRLGRRAAAGRHRGAQHPPG